MTQHEDRDRRLSRADAEIDRLLAAGPLARAPRAFADAVMTRLASDRAARAARGRVWLAAGPDATLPLWVRLWAEPSVALALTCAALLAWAAPWLLARAVALGAALRAGAGPGLATGAVGDGTWAWIAEPATATALGAALGLLALASAWPLYRATERWTLAAGRRSR